MITIYQEAWMAGELSGGGVGSWQLNPPPFLPGDEPAFGSLGQAAQTLVTPEEGSGKSLLRIVYLEKPGKGSPDVRIDLAACIYYY